MILIVGHELPLPEIPIYFFLPVPDFIERLDSVIL